MCNNALLSWKIVDYLSLLYLLIMKNLFTICLFFIVCFSVKAQFYGNPYITQKSMQDAYEWGRQLAEQQQAQQDNLDKRSFGGCYSRYAKAMAKEDFDEAENWAMNLQEHNEGLGYLYLGICYEVQGYSNNAKEAYQRGVNSGNSNCNSYLRRLKSEGPLTESQKRNVVFNFKKQVATVTSMSAKAVDEMFGGSGSNRTRSSKRGAGTCSRCHGTGIDPVMIDYNPGSRTKSRRISAYTECPYCGQTLHTPHWHQRCLDCSTH